MFKRQCKNKNIKELSLAALWSDIVIGILFSWSGYECLGREKAGILMDVRGIIVMLLGLWICVWS
ncbi:hypothetical protein [Bartonella grahamii]|uniref:hypothetical protein n=1 Tax=Bartonella grahamii TaxID=33045 RepID=UPI002E7B901D|nr:hypothetical protein [Bartonella grahamii]